MSNNQIYALNKLTTILLSLQKTDPNDCKTQAHQEIIEEIKKQLNSLTDNYEGFSSF